MKNFKDILREFRDNADPTPRNGDGGGDPHKRIMEFMQNTPFTHVTTGEHELHFKDSLDGARIVADNRQNHEYGMKHAATIPDERMLEYFGASTGTHDDVMDAIEHHIRNHPKLPSDLKPHVASTFLHIEDRAKSRANSINMMNKVANPKASENELGKVVYEKHKPSDDESYEHPNLLDDTHHLGHVIGLVDSDPDRGYFLKKDEYKD